MRLDFRPLTPLEHARDNRPDSVDWSGAVEPDEDVDALDAYGPIVDEVIAGRTEGHRCPVCHEGDLDCTFDGVTIKLTCPKCGRFFEGALA